MATYSKRNETKGNTMATPTDAELLEQAQAETTRVIDSQVIDTLRAKGFSWRAISDWLSERGISISSSQLWKRYGK